MQKTQSQLEQFRRPLRDGAAGLRCGRDRGCVRPRQRCLLHAQEASALLGEEPLLPLLPRVLLCRQVEKGKEEQRKEEPNRQPRRGDSSRHPWCAWHAVGLCSHPHQGLMYPGSRGEGGLVRHLRSIQMIPGWPPVRSWMRAMIACVCANWGPRQGLSATPPATPRLGEKGGMCIFRKTEKICLSAGACTGHTCIRIQRMGGACSCGLHRHLPATDSRQMHIFISASCLLRAARSVTSPRPSPNPLCRFARTPVRVIFFIALTFLFFCFFSTHCW